MKSTLSWGGFGECNVCQTDTQPRVYGILAAVSGGLGCLQGFGVLGVCVLVWFFVCVCF